MENGCDKDLRRVRRYDTFLAQMDRRRRLVPPDKVGDTPLEPIDRPRISTFRQDQSMMRGRCCSAAGEISSTLPADETIVENSPTSDNNCGVSSVSLHHQQYIIEGRYGPVIGYKSPNSHGTKVRNNRFQRFVAAKQHRRERTLKSSRAIATVCNDGGDHLITPENQQKANGKKDSILGNSNEDLNPGEESSSSPESERMDDMEGQDLLSLQHSMSSFSDSPTSVTETPDAQFFSDSSCSNAVPRLAAQQGKSTQKYLFVRVESQLNLKGAMKQIGNHESQKQTNKLTWWDDQVNKHKRSNLKSDVSCDVVDDVECLWCVDRIQALSSEQTNSDANGENHWIKSPILDLLQAEKTNIVGGLLSDCTAIHEWLASTTEKLFGSMNGKEPSPLHKVAPKNTLHLDCSSLSIDDCGVKPSAEEREATSISRDDSSLCDSEATPPTSNTSCCGSSV